MARGAVVVIVSDGWEREEPALVAREMERLRRLAWRIVWVNPRSASPAFAPLAGAWRRPCPSVTCSSAGTAWLRCTRWPMRSGQMVDSAATRRGFPFGGTAASMAAVTVLDLETPHGPARAHLHPADRPRAALVLGHGAGGGVGAPDLVATTEVALSEQVTVALVEQPYRVAGRKAPAPAGSSTPVGSRWSSSCWAASSKGWR